MRRASLLLVLLMAGCSSQSPSFQTGQWEHDFETSTGGQRVFWGGGGQCIGEADVADLPAKILSGTPFGECTASSSSLDGGKLQIGAACDGKAAATTMPASKVSLDGTYTPTSFNARLSARLEGDIPDKEMTGTISARRTGDCES